MKRTATKMRPIGPVRVMLAAFDALTLRTAGDSSNATGCWPAKASVAGGVCQSAADRVRQMQFHQIITKNSTGVKLCRGVFCFALSVYVDTSKPSTTHRPLFHTCAVAQL